MKVKISKQTSRNNEKTWYILEWGKGAGQRIASGIFTFNKPKDALEKNHNKEAIDILRRKQSQMVLDYLSAGLGYVPTHKLKANFYDFYKGYIEAHARIGNRHLSNSLLHFPKFLKADYISATDITTTVCERFRSYLLSHFQWRNTCQLFLPI